MAPSPNIRPDGPDRAPAGAGSAEPRPVGAQRRFRTFAAGSLLAILIAIFLSLASPFNARASLNGDLKNLPPDTSPKQACRVLIRNNAIKPAQEGTCRKLVAEGFAAAKTVSDSGTVTIASAAACAIQALNGKLKHSQMGHCSKAVAESASKSKDSGGGGGFDPIGAVGGAIGGAVGGVGDLIGGAVTGTLLDGFKAIIDLLFGGLQSAITVALVKWITTIPNLSGGHVGNLEASVAVGAAGLLAATMTISIVRFWSSGLTGNGAWAGAEGVARAAVAAALIGLWPQIFSLVIRLANALQAGILGGGVQAQLKALFRDLDVIGLGGGALTGGIVPMFLAIVIAVVGILMLLALVAMKIVITALTIVLFVAMPLALVVWPIPELAGIARFCLRSLVAAVSIPVVWCLIFGSFAAIGADTFSFHNTGKDQGIFGTTLNVTIVRPLVAIALLYLALVLPRRLLQMAPFFSGKPGAISHIGTGMAVRAGFSYIPRVGAAAAAGWQGNASQRLQVFGSSAEKAAAAGGTNARGSFNAAKEKGKSVASKLAGQTSQAAKGAGRASDSTPPKARQQDGADRRVAGRAGGEEKGTAASTAGMRLGSAPFHGPRTMQATIPHNEKIDDRRKEMEVASRSGRAVTDEQAREAAETLQGHRSPDRQLELGSGPVQLGGANDPTLFKAASRAALHDDPKQATGAFAEWSLTDNEHVSKSEKDAFWTLGNASPTQREKAFKGLEKTASASGAGAGAGGGGGERNRPPKPDMPSRPKVSAPRAPHSQPRQRGGI